MSDDAPDNEAPWPDAPPEMSNVEPIRDDIEIRKPSEDAIALAFTEQYKDSLKFDHDAGRWYQWDGSRWRKMSIPVAFHHAREIARRMKLTKSRDAAGAEKFAKSDPAHAVTAEAWDTDPMLLGTSVGVINLATGRMRKPNPEYGITKITGSAPSSGPPVKWLRFLDQITDGDAEMIEYLQRICGYCLTGKTTQQALFFIYGPGGNGKSVFLNVLKHIMGDYAMTAAMETFTASRFGRHATELAILHGARAVFASETEEGRAWAEARIKTMTGGDPITANFMRQDPFTYVPQFKIIIVGNHQPRLSNVDDAMRRRFHIIPFMFRPSKPDPDLDEKLKLESPQILGWMLEGCAKWQKNGLPRPSVVTAATDSYFDEQDTLGQWLTEHCDQDGRKWELKDRGFKDWVRFAKAAGEEAGIQKTFTSALAKRGILTGRLTIGDRQRIYKGFSLKPNILQGYENDE